MTERKSKLIKKDDLPKQVTDETDRDIIRHLKTSLSKIYAKYGMDYREELGRECVKM